MTKIFGRLLLAAALSLTFVAVPAFAQKCDPTKSKCELPPPSPPKDGAECSPGYWKNHPEEWVGICCDDGSNPSCSTLQSSLEAKGGSGAPLREGASEYLDACFGSAEETPCTDD